MAEQHVAIRERLADTRQSVTHKFSISGTEGYLTVGLFEDGRPGELFIKVAKQGSTLSGLMDTIGILTSICLQSGVPIETLKHKLAHTKYEPYGLTSNQDPELRFASSLTDYIFRWMGKKFGDQPKEESKDATLPRIERNAIKDAAHNKDETSS